MYRGKFANNQSGRSTRELLQERASQESAEPHKPFPEEKTDFSGASRNGTAPRNPAPAVPQVQKPQTPAGEAMDREATILMPPQGLNPQAHRPAAPTSPVAPVQRPAAQNQPLNPMGQRPVPNRSGSPAVQRSTPPQGVRPAPQNGKPGVPPRAPAPVQPPVKSGKKGTVRFYTCYFAFIALFFAATFFGLHWLKGWLKDYEAAQPGATAEMYFEAYFANPNWGALYDNSVTKGTDLEGKDAYVAHMQEKVGSSQLTYQETSAGLSGDKKYFVKLGDEKIASFTLLGDAEHITDLPDWHLGDIELIFTYDNSYRIQLQEGHKASVNGMELDDSYTIMKASTVAQNFLPVGTTGIRMWTQEIKNLMGRPNVTIVNEKGEEMMVDYDEETKTFTEQTKANTISDEQEAAAIGAAEVYGRYMISQANRGDLAKYFDASSDIYTTIRTSEKVVQQSFFQSYDFGEETVSDFTMYADDLFSAHVFVTLNVTRKDGTVKPFNIDTNLFFAKQSTGKWLAYDMTNEPVLEPVGQVRLTFMNGSEQLATGFYDTDATELDTPLIAVPEGKVFSGWTRETVTAEGQKVLEVMFTPDETGHVELPAGNVLEPMVLTALFENADAPQGGAE